MGMPSINEDSEDRYNEADPGVDKQHVRPRSDDIVSRATGRDCTVPNTGPIRKCPKCGELVLVDWVEQHLTDVHGIGR